MSSRIHGGATPHVEQERQEVHAEQTHAHQNQVSHLNMQRTRQRAKIQHNKSQLAAFYRNKRFATSQKAPSAGSQKLMRQLGQRPRPGSTGKPHGKEAAHEQHDDVATHEQEARHEKEPHQEHEQKRGQHHEHEQGQQEQGRQGQGEGRGQGQQRQDQPGQQGQQNPQGQSGQPGQQGQQDRPRGQRDKPVRFALKKVSGTLHTAAPAAPSALQTLAEAQRDAPTRLQSQALALAYARHVTRLMLAPIPGQEPGRSPSGHLPPMMMLNNVGPMAKRRSLARLQTQRNSALAQYAAQPGKRNAVGAALGHTLDMTLARQRFGVDYSDDEQSLAMVRQWLIDATAGGAPTAPASNASTPPGAPDAS